MPKHMVLYTYSLSQQKNHIKAIHVPLTRSLYHEMCSFQTYLIHFVKKGLKYDSYEHVLPNIFLHRLYTNM